MILPNRRTSQKFRFLQSSGQSGRLTRLNLLSLVLLLLGLFFGSGNINEAKAAAPVQLKSAYLTRSQNQPVTPTVTQIKEAALITGENPQPLQLGGLSDRKDITIPLPERAELARNSYAEILVNHSPLLLGQTSSFTFLLNDQPLSSMRLEPANSNNAIWRVALPAGTRPQNGQLRIGLTATMHSNDLVCPPTEDRSLWTTVEIASLYHLEYTVKPISNLSELAQGLFSSKDLVDRKVTVVLPPEPSQKDLARASQLIARMGSLGGFDGLDLTMSYGLGNTLPEGHLVFVGGPALYPSLSVLDLPIPMNQTKTGFLENKQPVPPDTGIITLSTNGQFLDLVVAGGSDEAADRAVQALLDDRSLSLMRAPYALIGADTVYIPGSSSEGGTAVIESGRSSFTTLGFDTQTVSGTGVQSFSYFFSIPFGSGPSADAVITVDYSYSSLLDPRRSAMTVVVNDVSVQAVPLNTTSTTRTSGTSTTTGSSFQTSRVVVNIPRNTLHSGDNQLTFRFGLYVARDLNTNPCENSAAFNDLFGTVFKSSEIQLNLAPLVLKTPTLAQLPYPFVGSVNPSLVAIPEKPSTGQLKLAAQITSEFGRLGMNRLYDRVVMAKASEITADQLKKNNVILIGTPDNNTLLKEINAKLPVSWTSADARTLTTSKGTRIALSNKGLAAILQVATSPWNSQQSVLAVMSDPANNNMDGMVSLIGRKLYIGKFSGNVLVLDNNNKAYTFNTLEATTTESAITVEPGKTTAPPASLTNGPGGDSGVVMPAISTALTNAATVNGSPTPADNSAKATENKDSGLNSPFLLGISGIAIFLAAGILGYFGFFWQRKNKK